VDAAGFRVCRAIDSFASAPLLCGVAPRIWRRTWPVSGLRRLRWPVERLVSTVGMGLCGSAAAKAHGQRVRCCRNKL